VQTETVRLPWSAFVGYPLTQVSAYGADLRAAAENSALALRISLRNWWWNVLSGNELEIEHGQFAGNLVIVAQEDRAPLLSEDIR
jgi:hypothetical protein